MKDGGNRRGFTIVELIVVITVIAILATISIFAFGHFQEQGRDSKRLAEATAIAASLEKYYDENGEYPGCSSLTTNATTVTGTSGPLKGLDQSSLIAPKASSGTTNSLSCSDLTDGASDYYAYVGDGSPECQTTSCLQFTLKYWDEESQTVKSIQSKRRADVNTSGALALKTGPVTYTAATVTWSALSNANGYIIQRDTQSDFNSGSATTQAVGASNTSYQFNDMAPNTKLFYRIKATSSTGDSQWSNVVSQTTNTLPVPTLSTVQTTPSQITQSWTSGTGVASYTIQRSTTNSFPTGSTTNEDTGTFTSKTYSDTPVAVARYYRVRTNAVDGNGVTYNGTWSSVLTYTTVVPAPGGPSVSAVLVGTNATGTTGTVTCSQGSTPYYAIRETHKANSGAGDSWSAWTSWTTSPATKTVAALQGNRHAFQAEAACVYSGVYSTSTVGSTASAPVRPINQPATPTWPSGLSKTWVNNTTGHYMNYGTYCPDGTWVNQTWFHSRPWAGANGGDFYHTFGFNDWWYLGPSGGANVEYWAQYTCISSYASESAWSNLSYDVIWVSP